VDGASQIVTEKQTTNITEPIFGDIFGTRLRENEINLAESYYKVLDPLAGMYLNIQSPTNFIIGSSRLSYSFVLNGAAGTQVPVHLDAFANTSGAANSGPVVVGSGFDATSFVHIIENPATNCDLTCKVGNVFLLQSVTNNNLFSSLPTPTLSGSGLVSFNGDLSLDANTVYRVDLFAIGLAQGNEHASARADPYFYIEPDFLATHPGYSLDFSAGVGNSPIHVPTTVPEASTWAMMIMGLGGIGAVARRRRRADACATLPLKAGSPS
jgi:hypothetical protein